MSLGWGGSEGLPPTSSLLPFLQMPWWSSWAGWCPHRTPEPGQVRNWVFTVVIRLKQRHQRGPWSSKTGVLVGGGSQDTHTYARIRTRGEGGHVHAQQRGLGELTSDPQIVAVKSPGSETETCAGEAHGAWCLFWHPSYVSGMARPL